VAIVSGIPIPFPFAAVSFTRSRRASQVSGDSPSLATQALGVGNIAPSGKDEDSETSVAGPHVGSA
jgi:hypothetical protein